MKNIMTVVPTGPKTLVQLLTSLLLPSLVLAPPLMVSFLLLSVLLLLSFHSLLPAALLLFFLSVTVSKCTTPLLLQPMVSTLFLLVLLTLLSHIIAGIFGGLGWEVGGWDHLLAHASLSRHSVTSVFHMSHFHSRATYLDFPHCG